MWRLGNKTSIAKDIIKHFPPHDLYIEPFFGAGGIFFNKTPAKYNILNDNDQILFNFYQHIIHKDKRAKVCSLTTNKTKIAVKAKKPGTSRKL